METVKEETEAGSLVERRQRQRDCLIWRQRQKDWVKETEAERLNERRQKQRD